MHLTWNLCCSSHIESLVKLASKSAGHLSRPLTFAAPHTKLLTYQTLDSPGSQVWISHLVTMAKLPQLRPGNSTEQDSTPNLFWLLFPTKYFWAPIQSRNSHVISTLSNLRLALFHTLYCQNLVLTIELPPPFTIHVSLPCIGFTRRDNYCKAGTRFWIY